MIEHIKTLTGSGQRAFTRTAFARRMEMLPASGVDAVQAQSGPVDRQKAKAMPGAIWVRTIKTLNTGSVEFGEGGRGQFVSRLTEGAAGDGGVVRSANIEEPVENGLVRLTKASKLQEDQTRERKRGGASKEGGFSSMSGYKLLVMSGGMYKLNKVGIKFGFSVGVS
ncbi:MAG: hypothetical protein ACI8QF_002582 [Limisphaerales bacterium]|jgi:hypothetical protein